MSGSLHYAVTPKAGEAELPLADTAGIRNGDTGWAEVATPCYTVSYEVVTSIKDIPGFESEEPPVHTHTPGEATRENVVDAQIGVEGSYDEVVRCTECGEIVSSTHVTIEDVPTGDASLTVFGMILVVSAIGIGVTTKKKKVS